MLTINLPLFFLPIAAVWQNKQIAIFFGSQTGTAEEYAIKFAKELKARFGTSPLVLDPEETDFTKLDSVPENCLVIFFMATYGEGEPTDNANQLMELLEDDAAEFSQGSSLEGLKYAVFGLGNRTYEHYNKVSRQLDARLAHFGATKVGERGEGDDDRSMEEDYLSWKDGALTAIGAVLDLQEGGGGDVVDFEVKESDLPVDDSKVYKGELSLRALTKTKGVHDAKNPYPAPISSASEVFPSSPDRSCVHMEFDLEGSGVTYQHGDHLAVWANNADHEVARLTHILGLANKESKKVDVKSLDPTLAKVPFPTPTTYEAVLKYYLDIGAKAGRQSLAAFTKFAPTEKAALELKRIAEDKEYFHVKVAAFSYTLGQVLQLVAGDSLAKEDVAKSTIWNIPFDRIISSVPRLSPRFYSISSSPKLQPNKVHITAVVLRYTPDGVLALGPDAKAAEPYVHGLATGMISQLRMAVLGQTPEGPEDPKFGTPTYTLLGPRNAYGPVGPGLKVPIHVRRSNFRMPTSPKVPVIMIGPGTGVAPFRGFVQERVATARKAKSKYGTGDAALADWGNMWLFYGCRKSSQDFLYHNEWPEYGAELAGKFRMEISFSRETFKADGSKLYVQDLIWDRRQELAKDILEKKAYIYICGEAKGMAQEVERVLQRILVDAKGSEQAGLKEYKLLKDRSRLLLDVWS